MTDKIEIPYDKVRETFRQVRKAQELITTVKVRALNGNRMVGKVGEIRVPADASLKRGDLIRFKGNPTTYRVVE